jgi:hypothetical protein
MPFSHSSFRVIWDRAGGREQACCKTCGIQHSKGYTLDCSHLDHTRDELYDDPNRGVLECLQCHLRRHISIYFYCLLKDKKKKLKEARYACQSLVFRIVAGEDRWDGGSIPNSKSDIKKAKQNIDKIFSFQLSILISEALDVGYHKADLKAAIRKVNHLRMMV